MMPKYQDTLTRMYRAARLRNDELTETYKRGAMSLLTLHDRNDHGKTMRNIDSSELLALAVSQIHAFPRPR